jgi:Sec-independent protein translocase protein TatA
MFGIGLPELILLMAVALIVVGPEKLPGLARGLAKQLIELKKAANVLKESLQDDEPARKDWDRDLPIGFSRPEELAAAGRKADAIGRETELSGEATGPEPGPEEAPGPPPADHGAELPTEPSAPAGPGSEEPEGVDSAKPAEPGVRPDKEG